MKWSDVRLCSVLLILLLGGIARIQDRLWWDSAVYIGMGKFLFSAGEAGLWEAARPPLLPFLAGIGWLAGIDVHLWTVLLSVAFAAGGVIALYFLLKQETNRHNAFLFALLFAISTLTIRYAPKFLADIPAMTLVLISLLFLFREKDAAAGAVLGLAILAKFTSVLYGPAFVLGILLREKKLKRIIPFGLASGAVLAPYAVWQWIAHGNPLQPFIEGQKLILSVAGTETCPTSGLFYVESLLFLLPLSILAFYGLGRSIATREWKQSAIAAAFILLLGYHSLFLTCKDERYLFTLLPFALLLAARAYEELKARMPRYFAILLIIAVGLQVLLAAAAYVNVDSGQTTPIPQVDAAQGWSSTPLVTVESDVKITEKLYYPVWSAEKARQLDLSTTDYLYLNTCDIPCLSEDEECEAATQEFISRIEEEFNVDARTQGQCTIYEARR